MTPDGQKLDPTDKELVVSFVGIVINYWQLLKLMSVTLLSMREGLWEFSNLVPRPLNVLHAYPTKSMRVRHPRVWVRDWEFSRALITSARLGGQVLLDCVCLLFYCRTTRHSMAAINYQHEWPALQDFHSSFCGMPPAFCWCWPIFYLHFVCVKWNNCWRGHFRVPDTSRVGTSPQRSTSISHPNSKNPGLVACAEEPAAHRRE